MERLLRRTAPVSEAPSHFISDQADETPRHNHENTAKIEPKGRIGRPPRPRPGDFATNYIQCGEHELPDLYRAHCRTVRRWRDELGRDELRAARRAYVIRQRELRRLQKERRRPLVEGVTDVTRFVTANGKALWVAVDPDSRCEAPRVCERKFPAFLAPFKSEEAAAAALLEAGGVLDVIDPPKKPGPQ